MEEKEHYALVHDAEVEEFLSKVGLLEKLRSGELRCSQCRDRLDLDAFGGVLREGDELLVVCRKSSCLGSVLSAAGGEV